MARTDGICKPMPDPVPLPWEPAATRVARDEWRKMKYEFADEAERRAKARRRV